MERYVGAIDQGTTGTRFMVFDHWGREVASAYKEHEQIYPKPAWVEHNPSEIWEKTQEVIEEALKRGGIKPNQIEAIGITNQRETTMVWDGRTGEPMHNAIVWQCRRTAERCEELEEGGYSEMIREKTGLKVDAYFSATKLEWLLDNVDGLREGAKEGHILFGTVDSWLIWNLTGRHVTDYTNASRTMLFNIRNLEWDDELLELFKVPKSMLPEPRPSIDEGIYGHTKEDVFFGEEVPVCGDLGDQQAAMFGQTAYERGEAKNTYGTGAFLLMNTGEEVVRSDHGLLTTIAYSKTGEPAKYALEGSIFITGAAIQWLRDGLKIVKDLAETKDMAQSLNSTEGVYFVPAFTGLGAPHWDPYARGTILGLTRGTRREHIVRAALESIAYQTRDVVEAMEADSGVKIESLKVDGGTAKNDFLCQFQSDILGVPVIRPAAGETTALGAAYAAGLAVGYWDSLDELRGNWRVERGFEPRMRAEERDKLYKRWKEAVKRSKNWAK